MTSYRLVNTYLGVKGGLLSPWILVFRYVETSLYKMTESSLLYYLRREAARHTETLVATDKSQPSSHNLTAFLTHCLSP